MVYISPQLALIMLSIVPPVAAGAVVYGRFVRKISKQTQDALSDATKVAEERYAWGKREGEGEGGWGVRLGCWAAGGVVRRRAGQLPHASCTHPWCILNIMACVRRTSTRLSNIRTVRAFAQEVSEARRYGDRVLEVFNLARREAFVSGGFNGAVRGAHASAAGRAGLDRRVGGPASSSVDGSVLRFHTAARACASTGQLLRQHERSGDDAQRWRHGPVWRHHRWRPDVLHALHRLRRRLGRWSVTTPSCSALHVTCMLKRLFRTHVQA